jgi:Uma2 family endonuclease
MGLPAEKRRCTVTQYLQAERQSLEKHEYRDGEVLLMAGGSLHHSLVTANVIVGLGNRLKGKPCRVFESNLRIRVGRKVYYTYPDASVICGTPQIDPSDPDGETVTNPRLLVEVLSPSTAAYDRGEKFDRYREIDSLQEYVIVWQSAPRVETFFRQSDGTWLLSAATGVDSSARLRSLNIDLPLAEVYAGVEFPPEPA